MRLHLRYLLLVCAVVALASFALGRLLGTGRDGSSPSDWIASIGGVRGLGNSPSRTFSAVLETLEDSFVDRISDERPLSYGAVREMLDELGDVNSRFLEPDEVQGVLDAENGRFHGIGAIVHFVKAEGGIKTVVANVLPGGPAQRAGLRAGDNIVKIDDRWVLQPPRRSVRLLPRGTSWKPNDGQGKVTPLPKDEAELMDAIILRTEDVMKRLGKDGSTLTLSVRTSDPLTLETLSIATEPTDLKAVLVSNPEPGAVTLKVSGFTNTIGPELDAGLRKARSVGAKRLVLDLRGSVGGPLERALQVASRFTEGSLGNVERKADGRLVRSDLKVTRSGELWDGPMAVLVDGTTLGTAELLASGLDAHRRANLVGSKTFGDGTEQNVLLLKDGSAMLLTTGKYFSANGATWNTRGVAPRTVVANADAQMKAALRAVKGAG